jgi:hypothetical protein
MRGVADDVGQGPRAHRDEPAAQLGAHLRRGVLGRVQVRREDKRFGVELARHTRAGDRLGVDVHHHQRRPRHVRREPLQRALFDDDHCP